MNQAHVGAPGLVITSLILLFEFVRKGYRLTSCKCQREACPFGFNLVRILLSRWSSRSNLEMWGLLNSAEINEVSHLDRQRSRVVIGRPACHVDPRPNDPAKDDIAKRHAFC